MAGEKNSPVLADERTQFAVLLFTDICDSTALKAHHGALEYRKVAELHNRLFERMAVEEELTLIKNTGDGYFARSLSVAAVVRFALRFQYGMRTMDWPGFPITTRVGIHAGEVADITTLGQADVLAPAADLVARVMGLAVGGQILLTRGPFDEARHFVRAHPAVQSGELPALSWLAHGPYLFKGCEEPVEVFEVGASESAPLVAPPDGEKAKRVIRPGEEETLGWRPASGLEVPGRAGWVLGDKIGEGGFGEVWLAEQAKTRQRRVFKFCFDEERLRSFKRELTFFRLIRDALGERADIARLYDVKLDEPPFFLESEYAERGNLVEWCAKQGGAGAVPMARRIDLMAQIAEAVAAAHSVGILHKDMKPQNVLMQSRAGEEDGPQITDFGIGALADKAALAEHGITAAGFTVNTLVSKGSGSSMTRLYAPPEQLTGKAFTVQGDVYALGVMLYQFVIGDFTRALAPGWEREVKDDLLREDLAECLDGEPARRLASASELVQRLRTLDRRRAAREAEHRRAAINARRKRNARIALAVGAVAAVIAAVMGVGLLRERELRKRADAAERLAQSRLGHAQDARDAAEKLVTEAIFGLKEKLLPLGKISIIEGMAAAAEEYYAKLPADLVSDVTRRHQVMLALNRALVAIASSDDEMAEASCKKALALARELSAKFPDDESLRVEQYEALGMLAYLRFAQDRREETGGYGREVAALAEDWLRAKPKSLGALRAKLIGQSMRLIAMHNTAVDPATALPLFLEAQATADKVRQLGGETLETRMVTAGALLGKAMMMRKIGSKEAALKLFAESDAAFRDAVAAQGDHQFLREYLIIARKWSIEQLMEYARSRGDAALEREAYRQIKELIVEQTALADFEPARLERWKQLGFIYECSHVMVRKFDGYAAWLAWVEKGIAFTDRAASPKFDRPAVRSLRVRLRFTLCGGLDEIKSAGWEIRTCNVLAEIGDILFAPTTTKQPAPDWTHYQTLETWGKVLPALSDPAMLLTQARAMVAYSQRYIEAFPNSAKALRDTYGQVGKAAAILRERGRPEAAEFSKLCEQWRATLEEKFADDPEQILSKCRQAKDRGFELLNAMRDGPAEQKDARFAVLETHTRESLAFLEKMQSRIPEYGYAECRGACFAAQGAALLDRNQFAAAESALREAVTWRTTASAKTNNVNDATGRRRDAADSQERLGLAVFKQGREDEGRKLCREAAEAKAVAISENSAAYDFRYAGETWRRFADLLSDSEKLGARQKALELFRESVRLWKLDTRGLTNQLQYSIVQAAWVELEIADSHDAAAHAKEKEAAYREALSLALEKIAVSKAGEPSENIFQTGLVREGFANFLLSKNRSAEAREQAGQLQKELEQAESAHTAKPEAIERIRNALEGLRSRLPAQ